MSIDIEICGWRVASEVPLKGFAAWTGDSRAADVQILRGNVPRTFPNGKRVSLETEKTELCRLHVPGVAAFEVRDARLIILETEPGASPGDLQACVTGTLLGLLCLLRNLLPLHASAVRMGQSAVCFTGHSGAGKSTLAAALARRGHPLLSDDVCAIDAAGLQGPIILPSGSSVRLAHFEESAAPIGAHVGQDRVKQHVSFTAAQAGPVPVSTIYRLERLEGRAHGSVRDVLGAEKMMAMHRDIFRYDVARKLGLANGLFRSVTRLCSSTRICVLSRQFDLSTLEATVGMLEELHCNADLR